jgi:hypothetical protein
MKTYEDGIAIHVKTWFVGKGGTGLVSSDNLTMEDVMENINVNVFSFE